MRRGELLSIRWGDVEFDTGTLLIRETKNGHARRIPLTGKAVKLLRDGMSSERQLHDRVFPVTANAFRLCWERCKRLAGKKAPGLLVFRFHDLRHEAVSRFFELGLSVPEVALISGHRDPRMLFRYTHLRAEDIVTKISPASQDAA